MLSASIVVLTDFPLNSIIQPDSLKMKTSTTRKVLLIEGPGGYIRLDRCMQSIDSWGGVYRFPLNLARIAGHLLNVEHEVQFIDMQADRDANLRDTLNKFQPDLCVLSSGFPSLKVDGETANQIKAILPTTHVSTFGVAPTLIEMEAGLGFFNPKMWGDWGFERVPFDSIITGGEPALGYADLLSRNLAEMSRVAIPTRMQKRKDIQTWKGRRLFNQSLYRSPFTGDVQAYVEGSYGCPNQCDFCVVPQLYGNQFSKQDPRDIVKEIEYVVLCCGAKQVSLWDEGTTFQRSQIQGLCRMLIGLRRDGPEEFKTFTWNTRSTTNLLDQKTVSLMAESGMSGITLGLESFDEAILRGTNKGTVVSDNLRAIQLLRDAGIISIGHIVLGLIGETEASAESTIAQAIGSGLDIAQFYCAIPYPGTPLYTEAIRRDLISVHDLTKYELCNPIMDTSGGLTHDQVGVLRRSAMERFYQDRKINLNIIKSPAFANWASR